MNYLKFPVLTQGDRVGLVFTIGNFCCRFFNVVDFLVYKLKFD